MNTGVCFCTMILRVAVYSVHLQSTGCAIVMIASPALLASSCRVVWLKDTTSGLSDLIVGSISLLAVVYSESASILSPMRQVMSAPLLVREKLELYFLTLILRVWESPNHL